MRKALGGDFGPKSQKLLRCLLYFCLSLGIETHQRYNLNLLHIQEKIPSIAPVEVVGVVRDSEKPSIFVPANDPSSFQWFYVDVPAIARVCGLPENTIYVEDINENFNSGCPYPVPKDVNALIRSSVMPQDHLNYTLTWYALSSYFCVLEVCLPACALIFYVIIGYKFVPLYEVFILLRRPQGLDGAAVEAWQC